MTALENEPDAAVDPEKDDGGKQEAAAERPFFVSPFREKVVVRYLLLIRLLHDDDSTNVYRQFGDVDP
ncbi:hypothetical protein EJB05_25993 [Eragrostis curvula]|uniref:Uncharacterized protein n=1 Tax=Eragrostis curvula TaxID=38414 RepID=A0A5J9UK27_9POAL|nr:hypothetical protein EJB05_25993 [Eragrostis curvula]